jgi:serine/threonine protein kinase
MDFCPGGELFYHLHNIGRLSEDQAKFYIAEILSGIEYLHGKDIVYRDLKPENILLDIDGHVRITDFGLSKEEIGPKDQSYSFCGSPEYMSPEMLKASGHGREVDFYSIGALLYEMLTGLPPFYDANRSQMYLRILNEDLEFPNYLSQNAKNLISGLLSKDPTKRLGSENGIEEIKTHPWLKSINWKKIQAKKVHPPFRPSLHHSNFDPEYFKIQVSLDEFDVPPASNCGPFEGFNFSILHENSPKEAKLMNVVDMASISTTVSRTGFFSRNSSQAKLSLMADDEDEKRVEEEKGSKIAIFNSLSKRLSVPDTCNTHSTDESQAFDTGIFKKLTAPKQKVHLVKRNSKKNET